MKKRQFLGMLPPQQMGIAAGAGVPLHRCGDPDTFTHQYLHFLVFLRVWRHRDLMGHSPATKVPFVVPSEG